MEQNRKRFSIEQIESLERLDRFRERQVVREVKSNLLDSDFQDVDSRVQDVDSRILEVENKKQTIADLLQADKDQIKNAFQNWDTLTEVQFRAVVKKIFKALIINEVQED